MRHSFGFIKGLPLGITTTKSNDRKILKIKLADESETDLRIGDVPPANERIISGREKDAL